jgi:putative methyltransferase (TIGR04325 family)
LLNLLKLKNAIREILPPFIFKLIKLKRVTKKHSFTYQGVFSSFQEVIDAYGPQPLYATQISRFESFKNISNIIDSYSNTQPSELNIEPGWANIRFNIITCMVASLEIDKVSFLDIGGGFGETYLNLKSACNKEFDYRILELEPTVDLIQNTFKNFLEVNFYTSLENIDFKPSIVYFGSSLQYFSDYKLILLDAISFSPQFIVISDTPMGKIDSFVSAQINISEIVIPCWILSQYEIVSILQVGGYNLAYHSLNYYPMHNFDNFDDQYRKAFYTNLIFKKSV